MSTTATERKLGHVKFFNSIKGYGFIIPADENERAKGEEVFVHHTAIHCAGFKSLAEGEEVEYDLIQGPKGMQAANVSGPGCAPVKGDPNAHQYWRNKQHSNVRGHDGRKYFNQYRGGFFGYFATPSPYGHYPYGYSYVPGPYLAMFPTYQQQQQQNQQWFNYPPCDQYSPSGTMAAFGYQPLPSSPPGAVMHPYQYGSPTMTATTPGVISVSSSSSTSLTPAQTNTDAAETCSNASA